MTGADNQEPAPLERERLSAAIERAWSSHAVAAVIAPGGFGKSVAIAGFLASRRVAHARLRIGGPEGGVEAFVRAALRAANLPIEAAADPARAARLVSAAELTFVVDGFEEAGADPGVAAFIEASAARRSGGARWLLAARGPGILPAARWCAAGLFDEPVDDGELAFHADEVAELARTRGLAEPERIARGLLEVTGGWPSAVAAGLCAAASGAPGDAIAGAARAAVAAELERTVLLPLDEPDRDLLIATGLFADLPPAIVDALGARTRALLDRLRHATSLVVRGPDGTLRYHPALAAFLRAALDRAAAGVREGALAAAVRALVETGRGADALCVALRVSPAAALATLRAHGEDLIDRGAGAAVRHALAALPEALRAEDPDVALLAAHVGPEAVADDAACRRLMESGAPDRRVRAALACAARLARRGREAEAARILAGAAAVAPLADAPARARAFSAHASAAARTRPGEGVPPAALHDAFAAAREANVPLVAALAHRHAADAFVAVERYDDALRHAALALDAAGRAGAPRIAARARAAMARAAWETGRPDNALAHLRDVARIAADADDLEMLLFALAFAADAAAQAGDEAWLAELDDALGAASDAGGDVYVEALGAHLGDALVRPRALRSAWNGRFAEALAQLDALRPRAVPSRAATAAEASVYAAAIGDLVRAAAERATVRSLLLPRTDDVAHDAICARALVALGALVAGDMPAFDDEMRTLESNADRLALRHICLVRAVRCAGDYAGNRTSRARLLEATNAMRAHESGGYAALIDALPIRSAAVLPAITLTASERRVLQLLCDGLTSREIAVALGRSILTIDSHVKAIVRKLRCSGGRREAVALALAGRVAGFTPHASSRVG
jgi:ATP/maltotriose-dependent transcriptional regulator MalT